jgi:hypothetical protein
VIQVETEREMVERHVREGERHVLSQREIVDHLRGLGSRTELAEQLLCNLEQLQALHLEHLTRLGTRVP